jgi:hypothetical protein
MALTELQVEALLDRISYKPDWRLEWQFFDSKDGDLHIRLWWVFKRADCLTGEKGEGTSGETIARVRSFEQIARIVFANALACETHEAREFYQVDGQRIFNPHEPTIDPKTGFAYTESAGNYALPTNPTDVELEYETSVAT